jgi:hypothetical protein
MARCARIGQVACNDDILFDPNNPFAFNASPHLNLLHPPWIPTASILPRAIASRSRQYADGGPAALASSIST